jgi:hypothetical protein
VYDRSYGNLVCWLRVDMRSSLVELIIFFGPLALSDPRVALGFTLLAITCGVLIERVLIPRGVPMIRLCGAFLSVSIVLGFALYWILGLAGLHPVPGNCVL